MQITEMMIAFIYWALIYVCSIPFISARGKFSHDLHHSFI